MPRSTNRVRRSLGAAACLLLAAASVAHERRLRLSKAGERFTREFSLEVRAPSIAQAMRLEPAGDLACDVVVEAALGTARRGAPPGGAIRVESAPRRDEELRAARDLMLDAIAARPGWAHHRLLLGRIAHAAALRSQGDLARRPELWAEPLWQAATGAPGVDANWVALGDAYLQTWSQLPPVMRAEIPSVLRRAFLDAEFVSRAFPSAIAAIGRPRAMSLLPDNPYLLDVATRALSRAGDIEGAGVIALRREKVERKKRAADLLAIEQHSRRGDADDLLAACQEWASKHRVGDLDDDPGLAQAARVLELWPAEDPGSWRDDPRGKLVRFFLDGRESDIKGGTLERSLESLSGVPPPVMARAKLLAGNLEEAQELASGSNVAADPAGWTPYIVQLARFELNRGRAREAKDVLERLPSGGAERCDVLLARRDVARALGDSAEERVLGRAIQSMRMRFHSAEPAPGSAETSLPFCLDADWARGRVLAVEIEVAAPALLVYGWDGGRSGTIAALESSTILRVPLPERSGGRSFAVRATAGGPVRELRAALVEPISSLPGAADPPTGR